LGGGHFDDYYSNKSINHRFADTDPYMQPYVASFAKGQNITPDELIDNIHKDPFYMYEIDI